MGEKKGTKISHPKNSMDGSLAHMWLISMHEIDEW